MNAEARHDLAERVAVVTGAGSGIGRAVALAYAAAGAGVACLDIVGASETAETISAEGGDATAYHVDVSNARQVREVMGDVGARAKRIDILAAIAGISSSAAAVDVEGADLDRMLDVTVKGTIICCQQAAKAMMVRASGAIVTMASTAIDLPTPGLGVYTAAKAAVAMFTKVLAVELGPHGIRANSVAPGYIVTPMTTGARNIPGRFAEEMASRTPLRRVATVEEVAATCLFLASDESSAVTGQTLRVNGGITAPW